jgi:hypothetical protein
MQQVGNPVRWGISAHIVCTVTLYLHLGVQPVVSNVEYTPVLLHARRWLCDEELFCVSLK